MNIKLMICFSLFVLNISQIFSMEENNPYLRTVDASEWVPPRLFSQALNISTTLIEEAKIRTITVDPYPDLQEEKSCFYTFGFSFSQLKPIHISCLQAIRDLYVAQGKRPDVGDFAAGHGFMLWKMIVAGGRVTGVELCKSAAKVMQQNSLKASPYLSEGEKLKEVCTLKIGNLLKFDSLDVYNKSYDITWSGNVIHFFTPSEATLYVKKVFAITKPGGYAFSRANAIAENQEFVDYYFERESQGEKFPGYFTINKVLTYERVYASGDYRDKKISQSCSLVREKIEQSPAKSFYGFYGNAKNSREEAMYDMVYKDGRLGSYKVAIHKTMHYYGLKSIRDLYESVDFIVEDLYLSNDLLRLSNNISPQEIAQNAVLYVNIIARRPV